MPLRPCIEPRCPNLTAARRCTGHQQAHDQARNARRVHYHGGYQQAAAHLREQAAADPATRCAICGHPAKPGDPWTAHHILEGNPASPLAAAHASCNYRHGDGSRTRTTAGGT